MQLVALDQIGVVPIGRARAPWSFPLDNVEDKASGNTASTSLHAPMLDLLHLTLAAPMAW